MFKKAVVALIILAMPAITHASSQDAKAPAASAGRVEGLWPSPKLTDLLLRRWAMEIGVKYELKDSDSKAVQDAMVKRWTPFLEKNRKRIIPLVNEFIEMRLELEPPDKKRVQEWAARAMPMFEEVKKQLDLAMVDVADVLPPVKRAQFELEKLTYGAGMTFAEQKLTTWQSGEFEQSTFWEPTGPEIKRRNDALRKKREEKKLARLEDAGEPLPPPKAEPEPDDEISQELRAWENYVAQFITTYGLDDTQTTTARSCLDELKQRATDHRNTRRVAIAKLEARIKEGAGTDKDLKEIEQQLTDLYGPIDDMFAELKSRIEKLPTADQRAKVESRSKRSSDTAKKKG